MNQEALLCPMLLCFWKECTDHQSTFVELAGCLSRGGDAISRRGELKIGRHRRQALIWCYRWEEQEVAKLGSWWWMEVRTSKLFGEHFPIALNWKRYHENYGVSGHSQLQNGMLGRRIEMEDSPEPGHWVLCVPPKHILATASWASVSLTTQQC